MADPTSPADEPTSDPLKSLRDGITDGTVRIWCYCYDTPEPDGPWVMPDDEHADTHFPNVDKRLQTATRAVMRHYGYTDEEIIKAVGTTCRSAGCEPEGLEWNCTDENGRSRHPILDDLERTIEILRVAFEAVQR